MKCFLNVLKSLLENWISPDILIHPKRSAHQPLNFFRYSHPIYFFFLEKQLNINTQTQKHVLKEEKISISYGRLHTASYIFSPNKLNIMPAISAQGETESTFHIISLCVSERQATARHILSMYGKKCLLVPSFKGTVLRWLNVGVLFCLAAVGLHRATFISHCAILDHMWTQQILKASSKQWHVQTLKSLSSLATLGPHPQPPCTTITRMYSSQGLNLGAVSTPITAKLPLYQLWRRVQYLWRAHLTAERS